MVEHVKHVLDSYKSLMGMLGYDVTKKGLYLFVSLAEEIRELLKEEKSHAEILEMLPALLREEYHVAFEMRKANYMEMLNDFTNSRKVTPENQQLNQSFRLDKENLPLGNALIFFAEYFNYIERIDKHTKEMIKKYSEEKKIKISKNGFR